MTTNQDQQGGASLPEPLAHDQEVAGLSGSSELAVAALASARKHRHVRDRSWWERLTFLTREPWPLLGVLAVQAGLSLRLVWSNTAFGDEALYLWSGHVEWAHWLHGAPVPNFAAYFSGAPVVYPPVGAVADSIGGLAAARILSMSFMLISTVLLYLTVRMLLFDKRAAVYAAAAFALLGPTLSLAFATHDAMALMLIALSAWLAVRASGRHPELFLLPAGAAMALANAAKYASALWDPAVLALAIAASWHAGPWIRLLRALRVAMYAGCALGLALFGFGGSAYEHGVLTTTVARLSGTTPVGTVLGDGFDYIGPVVILSLLAVISSRRASARIRFLCISVTAACWLAPLNQARIHTLTSLHKHVDFGAWFAAIAVGYVISQVSGLQHERSWRVAVALAAVVPLTAVSLSVSGDLYRWAPAAGLVARLEPLLRNAHARYLMDPESANIIYYYLHGEVYPGQLSLVQCAWWDPARHRELQGPQACREAIDARYYELIETDDAASGPVGTPAEVAVWTAIRASGAYRLVYRARQLNHPDDFYQIWQLRKPRGARHVAGSQR
jgi:Dolichyl-phosphate-mannose-protein mannosyltransferase